jgi:hypothetical protein
MRSWPDLQPILISRREVDATRWDQSVQQSLQQIVYAYTWYLDLVCDNWVAVVWPSAQSYQVILPLPVRRKYGVSVIQQPLFCQYLGFFYGQTVPDALISEFFSVFTRAFPYISTYNFHPQNFTPQLLDCAETHGLTINTLYTHQLSLTQPYESIAESYKKDRKTNLRRSRRYGWRVKASEDIIPLIDLFKQNHAQQVSGGVDPKAYELLSAVFDKCRIHAQADLWYAGLDNLHAGILIVRTGAFAVYLFNAADAVGRKGEARSLMLDRFFAENSGGQITFDFESPAEPNIVSFYKSFNATDVPFLAISRNALPFPFRQIQNFKKRLAALRTLGL